MLTSSPGSSEVITTTAQIISNVIDHDMNILAAVTAPRVYNQWQPGVIDVEKGISLDTIRLLEKRGHYIVNSNALGASQSILINNGTFYGAADVRLNTSLAKGF